MMREIEISDALIERWQHYQAENPVWILDELISQLLRQHFDEADIMLKSIEEQEGKGRG